MKIIAIIITGIFLFENTICYALGCPAETALRKPGDFNGDQASSRYLTVMERIKNNKRGANYLGIYRKAYLGPGQKEIAGKIIDIYNEAYDLKISEERKKEIIENRISLKYLNHNLRYFLYICFSCGCGITGACLANGIYALMIGNRPEAVNAFEAACVALSRLIFLGSFTRLVKSKEELYEDPIHIKILKDKLIFPLKIYQDDRCDLEFKLDAGHELAHFLGLPNHRLLANAYSMLTAYRDPAWRIEFLEYIKKIEKAFYDTEWDKEYEYDIGDFRLAEESLEAIADPVEREVVIRKVLTGPHFKDDYNTRGKEDSIGMLKELASRLDEKDYKIPSNLKESSNKWAYSYGKIMGFIAIRCYKNIDDAFDYIYKLGLAEDSRELNDFQPASMDLIGKVYDNPDKKGAPVTDIQVNVVEEDNRIYLKGRDGKSLFDKYGARIEFIEFFPMVQDIKKMTKEIEEAVKDKTQVINIKKDLTRDFSADDSKVLKGVVNCLKHQKVYFLLDNKHGIFGVPDAGGSRIFINKELFSKVGVFHEAGEMFLSANNYLIPSGTNAHIYLRGLYGLQDKLFGREKNENFSEHISSLVSMEDAENNDGPKKDIKKHASIRGMVIRIKEKGPAESLLDSWLSSGKKMTLKKIKSVLDNLALSDMQDFSRIEHEDVTLVQENFPKKVNSGSGKWIMGKLYPEKTWPLHFLLYYNEGRKLEKIFIGRSFWETKGLERTWFVLISDKNQKNLDFFEDLDDREKKIVKVIKKYFEFYSRERLLSYKDEGYHQIVRPLVYDEGSKKAFLDMLAGYPGMENLKAFIYKKDFPIPEYMVCVRDYVNDFEGMILSEGVMFNSAQEFPENNFIRAFSRRLIEDKKELEESGVFFALWNYFRTSHAQAYLQNNPLYSYMYDDEGEIRGEYKNKAIVEAFVCTLEAILCFRKPGNPDLIRMAPKLCDIDFLVEQGILPDYFWPEGFYPKFNPDQDVELETYYLPLMVYLYKHGEEDKAKELIRVFIDLADNDQKEKATIELIHEMKRCEDKSRPIILTLLFQMIRENYQKSSNDELKRSLQSAHAVSNDL